MSNMLSDIDLRNKFEILSNKLKAGLFEDVIVETKTLLKKRKHQVFFNILCIAYQNLGRFLESIEVMDEALRANPKNPHFLNNMGVSHYRLNNFDKAEYFFKRGLEIEPNYLNIINNLGNLKRDLNFTKEAIEQYKKCLMIKEDLVHVLFNLSLSYESLGDFENAEKNLKKIQTYQPMFTEADRVYSKIIKYSNDHEHYHQMKKKLENKEINDLQSSHLYFGLGKYFEDIKDYKNSYHNYFEGNKIIKKISKYDFEKDKEVFKKIKSFPYEKLKTIKETDDRKVIFIVGMPRSGTSLVEQILSSHKNVFGGGELIFLDKVIKEKFLESKNNENKNYDKLLLASQKEYFEKISYMDKEKKFFTDKAPLNFKYAGFIKHIFPNAKIINCKRDPIDVSWSIFKNYFSGSLYFSNDLKDIANFYNSYEDMISFWKQKFPKYIYDLDYKNLVNATKKEVIDLLNHCELDWDDNCLNHHKNTRSIKTASSTQVRKPIYKSALTSSKIYESYLNDLIKNIKY